MFKQLHSMSHRLSSLATRAAAVMRVYMTHHFAYTINKEIIDIFQHDDEKTDPIYARIAERHIHIDKLSIDELNSFWPCLEWTLRHTLGEQWESVEGGMSVCH